MPVSSPRDSPDEIPVQNQTGPASRAGRGDFTAGLFVMAAFAGLYLARDFFIPLCLALLLALILAPAVHRLERWRIPSAGGAILVLCAFMGLLAAAGYLLAGPISIWIKRGPETFERVSNKVQSMIQPMQEFKASLQHSQTNQAGPDLPQVEVKKSGLLKQALTRTGAFLGLAGTTFILLYFLLASGDALLTSIFANIPNPAQRERALTIGHAIKSRLSKYLLAITLISLAEGGLIALGLFLAGMPTPILWGALHAALNFIPYLGAITGLALTAAVAFISFDTVSRAVIPPLIYFAVMVADNFASPLILGKRLVLNPALVFVSLMFWGFWWGAVGILLAVPV